MSINCFTEYHHPYCFGVLFIMNNAIGLLTPR
jgi:TRAP-type C4-dicarboxylate transport system permease large subunit